jgi:hypothetical protein
VGVLPVCFTTAPMRLIPSHCEKTRAAVWRKTMSDAGLVIMAGGAPLQADVPAAETGSRVLPLAAGAWAALAF